ncbi:hypothetical protein F7734_48165 [Scytonema sp. UIC 10036]|uniref:Nmad2 family putative nucleotide modification protein n=1 Tax=Scytonema sp. UIC 10036 TaxID=2304196 RepID=UPI0012DA500A|nr:hypothetical protein [Scytonema sp. UIC 10036]
MSAPNPYWGTCTLVICKPSIRRTAQEGDWVVGMKVAHSPIGDLKGSVIYAMKVTAKMTMQQYSSFTKEHLPEKIPDWYNKDRRQKVGDSIYDFSDNPQHPQLQKSVHSESDRERDLNGEYALLSNHFFYLGNKAPLLPNDLKKIVPQPRGHQSRLNKNYVEHFLNWLNSLNLEPNRIYGTPFDEHLIDTNCSANKKKNSSDCCNKVQRRKHKKC